MHCLPNLVETLTLLDGSERPYSWEVRGAEIQTQVCFTLNHMVFHMTLPQLKSSDGGVELENEVHFSVVSHVEIKGRVPEVIIHGELRLH